MSNKKQLNSQISHFSKHISMYDSTKNLLLALISTLFLLSANFGIVAGLSSGETSGDDAKFSPSHAAIKNFCSSTLYPELCFSAIAAEPSATHTVPTQKDVIQSALLLATKVVQQNNITVGKLLNTKGLSRRGNVALRDCLETIDETLDELQKAMADLKIYPSGKSLYQHADDLKTLVSSTITNQDTCLNGFNEDESDKNVKGAIQGPEVNLEHMCSNALAMIKSMTDTDIANYENKMGITKSRKLMETEEEERTEWPKWMSVADRRLLQATTVTPNVVVAADGSGNFKTVAAAVAAAPEKSSSRYVIKIKAGVYNENVEVPKHKTNIMFFGDGASTTIITGSRNVFDGSTTFHSATVAVVGERFLARDITFQNTAGPSKHQAVALRVGADLSAFYRCNFLAYQDTLYVHSNRQFFTNCLIAGTVDFIFGNSAVVFQNCNIQARRPNPGQKNMVTAQGRLDPNQNTGIVIQKSQIEAAGDLRAVKGSFPTFLGRPWKEYSRTVIMQSSISDVIDPAGWHEWNGNFALKTLFYGEYQNIGAGAGTSQRVKWEGYKVIASAAEAQAYSPQNFIAGASWLGSTGFPFSPGL